MNIQSSKNMKSEDQTAKEESTHETTESLFTTLKEQIKGIFDEDSNLPPTSKEELEQKEKEIRSMSEFVKIRTALKDTFKEDVNSPSNIKPKKTKTYVINEENGSHVGTIQASNKQMFFEKLKKALCEHFDCESVELAETHEQDLSYLRADRPVTINVAYSLFTEPDMIKNKVQIIHSWLY